MIFAMRLVSPALYPIDLYKAVETVLRESFKIVPPCDNVRSSFDKTDEIVNTFKPYFGIEPCFFTRLVNLENVFPFDVS